ncbi:MAG: sulfide/dihydroorotate dehydrogenase-like FAD/NAD-binding protein [Phycisphaerales bacterium]|nr:sulfide/dihydroorotate dehydrogenase-like FAD/NAD-binding protein [Phycisphaerales bacterium]
MFKILDARPLASDVKWFKIDAPLVARHRQPGQFVIIRLDETGERIPLTMADADPRAGTIELIVKAIGKTTRALFCKNAGDSILDVMGPLGKPTELHTVEHAVLVGGGVGTAVIYPLAKALKQAGTFVTSITGGRSRDLVVLEAELRAVSDVVYATTDDGSYGFKGTVADKLAELIRHGGTEARRHAGDVQSPDHMGRAAGDRPIGVVYCAGPVPMMRAICDLTRPFNIPTIVSLNPIMVDGTGMCGGCRVTVGGKTLFACVDGPEFDGHQVDYAELWDRLSAYREEERASLERAEHECRLAGAK